MKQVLCRRVFDTPEALYAHAAALVLRWAREAIAARGAFRIVLAGGETPRGLYARLAQSTADWERWQAYFGDERCLPRGDPQRNDTMAREVWLDQVPIPPANVHAIPAELGPEAAAAHYAELLASLGNFDLVLLGLGEDGHTASLFPGQPLGDRAGDPDVLPVRGAPKAPAKRVTLSAARLSRAYRALFLVTGAAKRATVAAWRAGRDIPARFVAPPGGVKLLLDKEAAGTDH